MGNRLVNIIAKYRWLVIISVALLTLTTATFIPRIKIDTDPENMLSPREPVRVFHNEVKRRFALWDMIILGVVDEESPNGVFNPETLGKVYRITKSITAIPGVIVQDVLAPSTVDDIVQAGPGSVRFKYLMQEPPKTDEEALYIRDRALANPLFRDTLVSQDGRALVIYVPIEEKRIAHRVGMEIEKIIAKEPKGSESYHLTGLPIAEDTFGYEMFYQMRLSAPMAGVVIFALMWIFFRSLILIIAPMIVAVLTVIITMGLLVACGFTVHIMSSMIPIFLMPISVADSVHVLSMFFDTYGRYRDRKRTLETVMSELFVPMLYTSLTTMVGFASLTLTPIPPIRVFGAFVAVGVGIAWVLTVTLIPAYVMIFLPDRRIMVFRKDGYKESKSGILSGALALLGRSIPKRAKIVLGLSTVIFIWSCVGISRIVINDNPVKWFARNHPIRVADEVLNAHFGGTYEAYLVLDMPYNDGEFKDAFLRIKKALQSSQDMVSGQEIAGLLKELENKLHELGRKYEPDSRIADLLEELKDYAVSLEEKIPADISDEDWDVWDSILQKLEDEKSNLHMAKRPEVLRYVEKLQASIVTHPKVGKINALTDVVKKVHQELFEGRHEMARIPDSREAVAQCLFSYQGSHDPDDLWHFVTPDYRSLNLWFQLKSGDNRDMEFVRKAVDDFISRNPPPVPINYRWAGLTYINVVWQNKMVTGMLKSLIGSFAVVFLMMAFLFRSALWGILSMIPLTVTICLIYGIIGWVGKDYDMPVAVLSSLTLGMSIDFAIHFIQRSLEIYRNQGSWVETCILMFGEPGRAISRNAIVIALGFLPLLFAHLIPYRTVGFFIASIMIFSGVATLLILPSMITVFEKKLFNGR